MCKFLQYLKTQYLRSLKLSPAILLCAVIIAVSIAAAFFGLFQRRETMQTNQKTKVGIVGDFKHSYLEVGVAALKTQDASKEYLEFVEMEESEANEALQQGELAAYIRIPQDFIKDVIRGKDVHLTMVTSNTPGVIKTVLMKEVADMASRLVGETQGGIYGILAAADSTDIRHSEGIKISDELTVEYFGQILSREDCWEYEYVGVGHQLPFKAYYVCVLILVLCLLWGVTAAGMLIKTDMSLPRMLKFSGVSVPRQILAEYLPFASVLYGSVVVLFGLWGIGAQSGKLDVGILNQLDSVGEYLLMGIGMLPAVLVLAALQYFLYESCRHIISGVLLQILSLLALSYASGFLYPVDSLPPAVQTLSGVLPTGVAFEYTAALLTGMMGTEWIGAVAYTGLLLLGAMLLRNKRIGGQGV